MVTLSGQRIALLENRESEEFAAIVAQLGGDPVRAPAMEQILCQDDFNAFYDGLEAGRFSIAVFLNGAGLGALLHEAEQRRKLTDVLAGMRQMRIACRGEKPLATLKRYGLRAQMTTVRPHTSKELLRALSTVDVADRGVVLVHCGERNLAVANDLRLRGARVRELCPYEWALPHDLAPLTAVVRDIISQRMDAVLFTSQVQCRHLFQLAGEMGHAERLARSLNRHVVVGVVGQVCGRALNRAGVTPDVMPTSPNMLSLIRDVANYFASQSLTKSLTL